MSVRSTAVSEKFDLTPGDNVMFPCLFTRDFRSNQDWWQVVRQEAFNTGTSKGNRHLAIRAENFGLKVVHKFWIVLQYPLIL